MKTYLVYSRSTGEEEGICEGEDEQAALDAVAQAVGYRDYVEACADTTVEDDYGDMLLVEASSDT